MEDPTNPNSPENGEYVKCACGIITPHYIATLDGDLNWNCPACQEELELNKGLLWNIWNTLIHGDKRMPQWWLMWFFVCAIIFFLVVLTMLII